MFAWHNFIYLAPVALVVLAALLRSLGVDVDASAALDVARGRGRSSALLRALLPDSNVPGLTAAFLVAGWSITGLVLTRAYPSLQVLPGALVGAGAAAAAAWATGVLGTAAARRLLPTEETADSLRGLVGVMATVVSDRIDSEHGRARVTTPSGSAITIRCRHADNANDPETGEAVMLVAYDEVTGTFDVIR
ncbi:DUF1449 family protein [Candidatus Poribacteria bacterium]|nr:DUF1449 family protein [Candidatus Poribacteria bacterium]MBT5535521.1 DUF1449 family protein [Candidatus Poribacteria bacterium]MBT5711006.1 DUF1449 family protein [Candidatus Poribacteria bacterium]MBT7097405.1 DUF1449 family protein [Candidatus Poribacteria bacterium]MBT7803953.1 DUF1449 family protein [Candidatus Poribacteria bacterium]